MEWLLLEIKINLIFLTLYYRASVLFYEMFYNEINNYNRKIKIKENRFVLTIMF